MKAKYKLIIVIIIDDIIEYYFCKTGEFTERWR